MEQELLYKYFKGTTSEEEERLILDWVDASPENRKAFQKERMLYDIALFTDEKQMNRKDRKARIIPMLRWSARIAAVVIVAISFGFLFKNYQYEKSACQQTITVPAGQRAQITLADGTKVWLNSKSTLTYASNFGRKERNVELDGEAYFEVAFDSLKPFIVMTGGMEVQVLGTKFNIKAYTDDQAIFTTLVSGSVQIKERESAHTALLRPDEQCIYTTHDGRMRIHTVDPQVSLGWIHGRFVFENETLEEILKQLGRWYDVKIFFRDPQVAGYRFTGNVGRFDQISTLLRMIEKAYDISFTISDDTVIVSKK